MKKIMAGVVSVMMALGFAAFGYADGEILLDNGKDSMKAGKWQDAIQSLSDEVHINPASAEAHFLLGKSQAEVGHYDKADVSFEHAIRLDKSYATKISDFCRKTGLIAVDRSQAERARAFLTMAAHYQPEAKNALAQSLFNSGKADLQRNAIDQAQIRLSLASLLNESYKKDSCGLLGELGNEAPVETCSIFYTMAGQYCIAYVGTGGKRLLEAAGKAARIPGKEKQRDMLREQAVSFLGKAAVDDALPVVKYVALGTNEIGDYEAGERTPFQIAFKTPGKPFFLDIQTTEGNRNFTILTVKSGKKFNIWIDKDSAEFKATQWKDESFIVEFKDQIGMDWVLLSEEPK